MTPTQQASIRIMALDWLEAGPRTDLEVARKIADCMATTDKVSQPRFCMKTKWAMIHDLFYPMPRPQKSKKWEWWRW